MRRVDFVQHMWISCCTRGGLHLSNFNRSGVLCAALCGCFLWAVIFFLCDNGVQGSHSITLERQGQALFLWCSIIALEG